MGAESEKMVFLIKLVYLHANHWSAQVIMKFLGYILVILPIMV